MDHNLALARWTSTGSTPCETISQKTTSAQHIVLFDTSRTPGYSWTKAGPLFGPISECSTSGAGRSGDGEAPEDAKEDGDGEKDAEGGEKKDGEGEAKAEKTRPDMLLKKEEAGRSEPRKTKRMDCLENCVDFVLCCLMYFLQQASGDLKLFRTPEKKETYLVGVVLGCKLCFQRFHFSEACARFP